MDNEQYIITFILFLQNFLFTGLIAAFKMVSKVIITKKLITHGGTQYEKD